MKTLILPLLAILAGTNANAQSKKLICSNDFNLTYQKAEIEILSRDEIKFKVLASNRDIDLGLSADLFYKETVHPRGRTFFHYHGKFEEGASAKTYSLYLSEDETTLTEMIGGRPYNWSCEEK